MKTKQNSKFLRVFCVIVIALIVFMGMYKYQHTFTTEKWTDAGHDRTKLVDDLLEKHNLIGMSESEVIALLGAEDSDRSSFKISRVDFPPETTLVYYLGVGYMDDMWLIVSLQDGVVYEYCIDVS